MRALPLLLALDALAAPAARLPDCIHVAGTTQLRQDLSSVRACQEKYRRRVVDQAEAKGKPVSEARLEEIDEHHRAEARSFLSAGGAV